MVSPRPRPRRSDALRRAPPGHTFDGGEVMSTVIADAVEHLVKGIVDHPDDVRVELVTNRKGRTLEVRVHPEDLGKVIGRSGRTATALRTVVGGIGGRGVRVDVVDTDR